MSRKIRRRFWFEAIAAVTTAMLTFATLINREWIELVFRIDPDNHSGFLEWLIVAVFFVITISLVVAASHDWRTARASLANPGG